MPGYLAAVDAPTPAGRSRAEAAFATLTALGASRYRMSTAAAGEVTESLTGALPNGLDVTWSFRLPADPDRLTPRSAFWRSSTSPSVVHRTTHALVLAPADSVVRLARIAEESVQRVLGVWRDLPSPLGLAVVVARDAAEVEALAAPGRAVATSTRVRGPGPLTIVVAPDVPGAAGQVTASVLTHEVVHVVGDLCARSAGAAADRAPRWLREGLAEFISADTLDLTDELRAAARASIRSGPRPPPSLPDDEAFADADADPAYDLAWLAVSLLVDQLGMPGLISWYRCWSEADRPDGRWPVGVNRARLEDRYRHRLSDWRE